MSVRTTNSALQLQLAPAGMHVARCYRVIDCGSVHDRTFGKMRRVGWLFWELPATNRNAGKSGEAIEPYTLGKRYTLSHNEKSNLRIDLESWYGRRFETKQLDEAGGFDLARLIGRAALINVVHTDDGQFSNVASVNPLPAGMACPPAVNGAAGVRLRSLRPDGVREALGQDAGIHQRLGRMAGDQQRPRPGARAGNGCASARG